MEIRRLLTIEDQVLFHGGVPVEPATRKVAAIAVIANPFAGRHTKDLQPLIDSGAELGRILAERIVKVLGADRVQSYGKACIVGVDGEIEHSAALMHPTFGKPVREAMGGGAAVIPSTKKIGGPGTRIDIPFFYKDAALVFDYFDAMEVGLPDAPRADEILLALAMADGPRCHARVPGLSKQDAIGEDGMR